MGWSELSEEQTKAAAELGYTEAKWNASDDDLETVPLIDDSPAAEPEPEKKKAGAFDGAKQMYLNAQKAKLEKIAAEKAAAALIANAPDPTKWVFNASIFSGSYTVHFSLILCSLSFCLIFASFLPRCLGAEQRDGRKTRRRSRDLARD
jgi:hypothetical protein